MATKPSGASVTASKWLIHTSWRRGQVVEQLGRAVGDLQLGAAVLAAHASPDFAAELLGDQLGAVADAEDRDAEVVDRRVERRRAVDVHALRTTGQDERGRWIGGDLGRGDAVRHDLAVHVELADPPGDQLRVLRSEVDDQHRFAALHHCRLIVRGGRAPAGTFVSHSRGGDVSQGRSGCDDDRVTRAVADLRSWQSC